MTRLAGVAMAVLAAALLLGLVIVGGVAGRSAVASTDPVAGGLCVTVGPVPGLSPLQAGNARTIVAVAGRAGGAEAALVAILTALTESGLLVLGNVSVATGSIPTEGMGSMDDSLGLFQQRASWGSVTQRLDPAVSTGLFVSALLADRGWQAKPPWAAAQDVQRSAWTGVPSAANGGSDVYGGNYEARMAEATQIVSVVGVGGSGPVCGELPGAVPAGPLASHGLPAGYTIPADATGPEVQAVGFALAQLGKRYVWGAAGPDAYDCSGLTMAAWATAGMKLAHYTVDQLAEGTAVAAPALMAPGDLILVPGADGTLAAPGHVQICG